MLIFYTNDMKCSGSVPISNTMHVKIDTCFKTVTPNMFNLKTYTAGICIANLEHSMFIAITVDNHVILT
jgi:hypothetical protein